MNPHVRYIRAVAQNVGACDGCCERPVGVGTVLECRALVEGRGPRRRLLRALPGPVALVSAGTFALLHAGNLLVGQSLLATGIQLVYTFFFGILMYLAMRVTRTLLAPVLLHASTDPSIFMHAQYPADGARRERATRNA